MTVPPTRKSTSRPCRFCQRAQVRIFCDVKARAWVFDAEAIADERTPEFCTRPPSDVFVLHIERRPRKDAPAGTPQMRTVGWVKPAAESAPAAIRQAPYLLRLHMCAEWLTHRARKRQEAADAELDGMRLNPAALFGMSPDELRRTA